ncbi:ABC transporter ATP-binding protein [Trichocoleus desertorum AS-A10]|uniref:ABC transporter ATP-binding protein n=1 Tax=Trichocoleus desertorum TaxID=1481672 RepID=UPI003299397C
MIEVEQLSKVYGSTPAIQDVTFAVEPGEILGFLGPNGAGKTTTMRILTGYLPATSGSARVAGYDVHEDSMAVRQRIGYLPETPPLYPEMTVEGFLYFVARIKGVSAGDRSRQVQSALERCSLVEKRKTLIRKLSKGFRQRVGIAQAIVHDPPAIILDEPTVGLDPRQIIEVRNLIKNLAGTHTVILSTHILPEVSMTCNRVAIINRGRVVATNSPENLMAQLNAGSGYELDVDGDVSTVQQLVQPIPGVRLVELMRIEELADQALTPQRCRVRVVSEADSDPGRDIAAAVVGGGLGLYEMRRTKASLEDVFLQLTMTEEKALESSAETELSAGGEAEPVIEDAPGAPTAVVSESAASEEEA